MQIIPEVQLQDFDVVKNKNLGQVWTPDFIAKEMVTMLNEFSEKPIRKILDPACGPATFQKYFNILKDKPHADIFDIDPRMTTYTENYLSSKYKGKYCIYNEDYLNDTELDNLYDCIISNPPYIRHEDIEKDRKKMYLDFLEKKFDVKINGRMNLYGLFLLKSLIDLNVDGLLCTIVYDSIKQTSYGKQALSIVNQSCELIIEKKVLAPFESTLIDARILLFRKKRQKLTASSIYKKDNKKLNKGYVRLSELLNVKRGIGFPQRSVFLLNNDHNLFSETKNFVVKISDKEATVVENADQNALLFHDKETIPNEVNEYFKLSNIGNKYIVPNNKGTILFNYYIRGRSRHLFNKEGMFASDNFLLIDSYNTSNEFAWLLLNSSYFDSLLFKNGRTQGSGLLKLQVVDYKNIEIFDWKLIDQQIIKKMEIEAKKLINSRAKLNDVRQAADAWLRIIFDDIGDQSV